MKNFLNYMAILLSASLFFSCEDVIDVDLEEGLVQLAVDAWITDQPGQQDIQLTMTQGYFNNAAPQPALGATISITDNEGRIFDFVDDNSDGIYSWFPDAQNTTIGRLGNQYTLRIGFQGDTFEASSQVNRVPPIDSITYEFREEEIGNPEGHFAEFFARDFVGPGDTYWIRAYRNAEFLNRPGDINLAYDAGFSQGGNIDGLPFITPTREGINPFYDDDDNDELDPPYVVGDQVRVEIHSITEDAFFFLQEMDVQLNNGGLFAVPVSNVRTNIQNTNPNSSVQAVGYFGTAAVSSLEGFIESDKGVIR